MTTSIAIKAHRRTSSGCARTVDERTPGGLRAVPGGGRITLDLREQPWSPIAPQESAEGIVRASRH